MSTVTTEITPAEVLERIPVQDEVGQAARALDLLLDGPGWAGKIDLDRLDLECPTRCILGQIGRYSTLYFQLQDGVVGTVFACREFEPRWAEEVRSRTT